MNIIGIVKAFLLTEPKCQSSKSSAAAGNLPNLDQIILSFRPLTAGWELKNSDDDKAALGQNFTSSLWTKDWTFRKTNKKYYISQNTTGFGRKMSRVAFQCKISHVALDKISRDEPCSFQ